MYDPVRKSENDFHVFPGQDIGQFSVGCLYTDYAVNGFEAEDNKCGQFTEF